MRFAVDAHALGRNLTGNEVYVRNLLAGYAQLDKQAEFVAYVSESEAPGMLPQRFTARCVSSNPFKRLGWDLPSHLRRDRPDVVHVQYTAPLYSPTPIVVTVHDVSFLERPEYFPAARVRQLRLTVKNTVRRAARVLTPSEFSAQCIQRVYDLPPDSVTVIPNGVGAQFRPGPREAAAAKVRERFKIPGPYILMVGDLQPRKNQTGLITAFEQLLRHEPGLAHDLVLTGQDSWFASRVREMAAKSAVASRIHFTGFVKDDELLSLYNASDLFVFPSFYEGFGIPILEAMACGRAVVCSSITASVEVADGAAITFDPGSPAQMMRSIRGVLLDHELRARMEKKGLQRAAAFQWKDAARKTLDVYYQVAESHRRAAAERKTVAAPR